MKQYPGKLVVLEGPDMAGKTTQRIRVVEHLRSAGLEVVETREPGGTPFAERIRDLCKLAMDSDERKYPETELLLNYASRHQVIQELIVPALKRGAVVVTDRFHLSSYVYQVEVGGVGWEFFQKIDQMVRGDLDSDLTFVFTVDDEVAETRLRLQRQRDERPADHFDDKDVGFKRNIRAVYRRMAQAPSDSLGLGKVVPVDANVNEDQIFAQLVPHLMALVNDVKKRPTPEIKVSTIFDVRGVEIEVVNGDELFRIGVAYQDGRVEFVTSDHEDDVMVGLSKTSFDQFPARLLSEIIESVVNNLSIKQRDWIKELRVERAPFTGESIAISAERDFRI